MHEHIADEDQIGTRRQAGIIFRLGNLGLDVADSLVQHLPVDVGNGRTTNGCDRSPLSRNRDPHLATVGARRLSVATVRREPAVKERRLASGITTESVSIVGRTGAAVAYPFGRTILEWCAAQDRAVSESLFLVAPRTGRDGQQEAQVDATGEEDRALEQAPAALEP